MPTEIVGQNGAVINQTTKIALQGCKTVKSSRPKKLTRAQLLERRAVLVPQAVQALRGQTHRLRKACPQKLRHQEGTASSPSVRNERASPACNPPCSAIGTRGHDRLRVVDDLGLSSASLAPSDGAQVCATPTAERSTPRRGPRLPFTGGRLAASKKRYRDATSRSSEGCGRRIRGPMRALLLVATSDTV